MSRYFRALSRESREFVSPLPKYEDGVGPQYTPVWLPALAALAAFGAFSFALLLYSKI